jgi:GH25 family lysozyme M1 (1,4-beta-N-acetylmuramidase)
MTADFRRIGVTTLSQGGPEDDTLTAIDISGYQIGINWERVRSTEVAAVYVKLTEGTWYLSPDAAGQIEGARSIGRPVACYHFAAPEVTDGEKQAAYFVNNLPRGLDLVPMLDVESAPGPALVDWSLAWLASVEWTVGRPPILYCSLSWWNQFFAGRASEFARFPKWIAAYNNDPTLDAPWDLWQWSSTGRIDGIVGNVDLSRLTRRTLDRLRVAGPGPPPDQDEEDMNLYPSQTANRHNLTEVGGLKADGSSEFAHLYLNVANPGAYQVSATIRRKSTDGTQELSSKSVPLGPFATADVDLTTMAGAVPGLVQVESVPPTSLVTVSLRGTL